MFNKTTIKLPPRIEKWVMDMQDVDFELIYEPGKDEADPLDFLSRHPLPEKETDETEKIIKVIIANEHAVVLERLQEETLKDQQLQKLKQRILKGDWEQNKKDDDISPFYYMKQELYVAEGLIFRLNQIVIPSNLQQRVIRAAHSMGHLGMTKTKQMLHEKYWFPTMNSMVEKIIGQCYECQVATKQHKQQPLKMTVIPEKPWEVVSIDFGGPYPDGHYNLVAIDKRTRYPMVESLRTITGKQTIEKLRKIFSIHGTPSRVESDNGPPFNSGEFSEFAMEQDFKHHRVTPGHPRANGEAEVFMKLINKTEQIANLQNKDSATAIQEMLMGYRSTPHPATGISPYEALMNRPIRTKLGYIPRTITKNENLFEDINERDKQYKEKIKKYAENRNTQEHAFQIGDYVLLEQTKRDKWTTAYEPAFYIVYRINGSAIRARRVTDGREMCRDASKFKLADELVQNSIDIKTESGTQEDKENGPPARQAREGAEDKSNGPPARQAREGAEDKSNGPPARQAREGADWRERLLWKTRQKHHNEQRNNRNQENQLEVPADIPKRDRRAPQHFRDYVM
ncbi:unnamed protein product [Mytilus coruscus]|uniref:Integrase catalytic domain-containing protein n=1 Tax=Mytilus coruscus TaxID=42192 RepID=A0A6J8A6S8_MYTCO|nr:unnamed protein product [Mytilus coruscus]